MADKKGGKKGAAAPELPRFGRVRSNLKVCNYITCNFYYDNILHIYNGFVVL